MTFFHDDMRSPFACNGLGASMPQRPHVDPGEQMLARAEQDRTDREMQLVAPTDQLYLRQRWKLRRREWWKHRQNVEINSFYDIYRNVPE